MKRVAAAIGEGASAVASAHTVVNLPTRYPLTSGSHLDRMMSSAQSRT